MTNQLIANATKDVVERLVGKQYEELATLTGGIRLSKEMIEEAISAYGRDLVLPPDSTFDSLDIIPVRDSARPRFSIRCPLWTKQEGRSDLTVELTVTEFDGKCDVELDDIRVL